MSRQVTTTYQPRYAFSKVFYTAMVVLGTAAILVTVLWAVPSAEEMNEPNFGFNVIKLAQLFSGIVTGVFTIATAQIGHATIDNANANQEILALMKRGDEQD